jgi:hypothetical protein
MLDVTTTHRRTTSAPPPRPTLLGLAIAIALALAACSSQPTATGNLDCHAAAHACTWDDVTPAARTASLDIAAQARALLDGGGTLTDLVTILEGKADMAEVLAGSTAVRFRLQGGRPVWVALGGPATATATVAAAVPGAMHTDWHTPAALPHAVVGPGTAAKRAVVLSPFASYGDPSDNGAAIAALLAATRGYSGRVTHLANSTPTAGTVTLNTFKALSSYDVVYVHSYGYVACDIGPGCTPVAALAAVVRDPADASWQSVIGVDVVIVDAVTTVLALSRDFFTAYYPGGFANAIVWIQAANGADPSIAAAIHGPTGAFVGWEGVPAPGGAALASTAFMTLAAETGSTIGHAFDTMGLATVVGAGQLVIHAAASGWGDHRLREVVVLRDPDTLEELTNASKIVVDGFLGDGSDDALRLVIDVDGMTAADAAATSLSLVIDGWSAPPMPLTGDDWAWVGSTMTRRLTTTIQTPHDFATGATISLWAHVALADGGLSEHAVSPTVRDVGSLPHTWVGTSTVITRLSATGSAAITRTATVSFTRDPSQSPSSPYPKYLSDGGTMTWRISGTYESGCSDSSTTITVPIPPRVQDYIWFDVTVAPFAYDAFGSLPTGPSVTVTNSCSGTYSTTASGVWMSIPVSAGAKLTGPNLSGTFTSAGATPTTTTWSFTPLD